MATGGAGTGGLLRALGVEITVTADFGGVPTWVDQPDETRQKLIEIAQRVFKDTLDGVVRFEHEHITQQSYTQSLVVFALPTSAHKDIVLGGVRELASRIQEDISTRLGRMGARPTVQINQDRSFTSGPGPMPPPVQPAGGSMGQGSGYGSGYGSQGAVTTMQSTGSGDGGGPVPMVLVPAFGQRQEAPPPPPPPTEEKPIIPNRVYPLLIASAIAGISLAANAFLAFQLSSIREQRSVISVERDKLRTEKQGVEKELAAANGNLLQYRTYADNLEYGRSLYAQSQTLRDDIKRLADSKNRSGEASQIYARIGPIPELNEAAWPQALDAYRRKLEIERDALAAKPARPGPPPLPGTPTPRPEVLPTPNNR
jgi:hypothetical protein